MAVTGSTNTTAVPLGNVVVGGSGANRTVTVTGAAVGTRTITLTATDRSGNVGTDTFIVTVTNPNNLPTDIGLTPTTVNQGAGANAVVGTLTTTDADGDNNHTYTLVAGAGDDDNTSFNIDGTSLRANNPALLNPGSYSVRILTTDIAGGTYSEAFTITVVDNVAPSFQNSTPALSATTTTGSTLTVRSSEAGMAYYVVVPDDASVPSSAHVKAGQNAAGAAPLVSGSVVTSAGVDATAAITGLLSGTAYDVYVVTQDAIPNLQASATKVDLTTLSGTVTLSVSPNTIAEAAGTSTVTATLSAVSSSDVTVSLSASGTASGADYSLSPSSITITAGQMTGTTTVTAVSDALDEADETIILDIDSVSGGGAATENNDQQQIITITDDDDLPALSIGRQQRD